MKTDIGQLYRDLAVAEFHLQTAKRLVALVRAQIEQDLLDTTTPDALGKTVADRDRRLALHVGKQQAFIDAQAHADEQQLAVSLLKADIEDYLAMRREYEWSVREDLTAVLRQRFPAAASETGATDPILDEQTFDAITTISQLMEE